MQNLVVLDEFPNPIRSYHDKLISLLKLQLDNLWLVRYSNHFGDVIAY